MNQTTMHIAHGYDVNIISDFEACKALVTEVRSIRKQKNIPMREALTVEALNVNPLKRLDSIMMKMAGLDSIEVVSVKSDGTAPFMVGTAEFAVRLGGLIDIDAELAKLDAELAHLEGFLKGVMAKLGNSNFVAHAPAAVVELERKKQSDAEQKIAAVKENMRRLGRE